jgi:hypothetical protein
MAQREMRDLDWEIDQLDHESGMARDDSNETQNGRQECLSQMDKGVNEMQERPGHFCPPSLSENWLNPFSFGECGRG